MKIIKPKYDQHNGDTFRELVDLWVENCFCEVEYQNVKNVWLNDY